MFNEILPIGALFGRTVFYAPNLPLLKTGQHQSGKFSLQQKLRAFYFESVVDWESRPQSQETMRSSVILFSALNFGLSTFSLPSGRLFAMILIKVRFENQQKKNQLAKKIKRALFFGSLYFSTFC
ncbi:MAG: hypothetical protein ACYC01_11165 [Lutibacter sp.]